LPISACGPPEVAWCYANAGAGVLRLLDVTNVADLIEVDDPGPRPPVLARAGSGRISVR
jgi:hypothetical protein